MNRCKQSKENQVPIRGVILAYGKTDYCEEEVFIVNTDPIILVKNDHEHLIDPIEFIGQEVEFLPLVINESEKLVIASLKEAENITGKNLLNKDEIIIKSAIVTDIFEWGCILKVNDKYTGRLLNSNYFINIAEEPKNNFRGGSLMSIFSIGDEISNLECTLDENKSILELFIREKIDISNIEKYPVNSVDEIQDNMVLECAIRDVFPNGCYVKIAPKVDALCNVPENLTLDRDVAPEDIVKVVVRKYKKGFRGKIIEVVKSSNFRYEEMDGEDIC